MFIPGSSDIGIFYSNMQIEAYFVGSYMEVKNLDFENQFERHEEKSKVEEVLDKSV